MKLLLLFICCPLVVYGWTSFERVPENPDGCKVENVGMIKVGESITIPGRCQRASCSLGLISYAACGSVSPPKGCSLGPEDLSKEYPDCCPRPVCP